MGKSLRTLGRISPRKDYEMRHSQDTIFRLAADERRRCRVRGESWLSGGTRSHSREGSEGGALWSNRTVLSIRINATFWVVATSQRFTGNSRRGKTASEGGWRIVGILRRGVSPPRGIFEARNPDSS